MVSYKQNSKRTKRPLAYCADMQQTMPPFLDALAQAEAHQIALERRSLIQDVLVTERRSDGARLDCDFALQGSHPNSTHDQGRATWKEDPGTQGHRPQGLWPPSGLD